MIHSFGVSQSQTSGKAQRVGMGYMGVLSRGWRLPSNQANASPCPVFQRCQRVMGTGTQGFRCRTLRAAGRSVSVLQKWTFPSFPLPSLVF